MSGSMGGAASSFGSAASDLFTAMGAGAAIGQYQKAENLAMGNVEIAKSATAVQEAQQKRMFEKTQGAAMAGLAANGLSQSGSALDILRSNAQQGSLANSLIGAQGVINEQSYREQAAAYSAKASAAKTAQDSAIAGAFFGIVGGAASMMGY